MKKNVNRFIACFLITFLLVEVTLRVIFGFCDSPLFESSEKYEYFPQPNQNRFRFLCHYKTNSFGMRSEEPNFSKKRVLGLGDSVLYGGTWMDQDSLASTIFSNTTGVQMLNISAGSWGPDNCVAYLKSHGTFGASAIVLVCSSHDAYDKMSFAPVVGVYPNYPEHQYKMAVWELFDRFLIPQIRHLIFSPRYVDPDAQVAKRAANREVLQKSNDFIKGFDDLKAMADTLQIPFYVYLHAEKGEIEDGRYNDMGQEIIKWARATNVILIDGIKNGEEVSMYHDSIHFNKKGQKHLAKVLIKSIKL